MSHAIYFFLFLGAIFSLFTVLAMRSEEGGAMPIGFIFPGVISIFCFGLAGILAIIRWLERIL